MAECPVCMEAWTDSSKPHLPKILGCGHTLCEDCCGTLSDGGKLECPTCRKEFPFTNAKDFVTNFSLVPEKNVPKLKPKPAPQALQAPAPAPPIRSPVLLPQASRLPNATAPTVIRASSIPTPTTSGSQQECVQWLRTHHTKRGALQEKMPAILASTPDTIGNYVVRYLNQNANEYHLGIVTHATESTVYVVAEDDTPQPVTFECISNGVFKEEEVPAWLVAKTHTRLTQHWKCASCTMQNDASATHCSVCESIRGIPHSHRVVRTAEVRSATVVRQMTPPGKIACLVCTFENEGNCSACTVCTSPLPAPLPATRPMYQPYRNAAPNEPRGPFGSTSVPPPASSAVSPIAAAPAASTPAPAAAASKQRNPFDCWNRSASSAHHTDPYASSDTEETSPLISLDTQVFLTAIPRGSGYNDVMNGISGSLTKGKPESFIFKSKSRSCGLATLSCRAAVLEALSGDIVICGRTVRAQKARVSSHRP